MRPVFADNKKQAVFRTDPERKDSGVKHPTMHRAALPQQMMSIMMSLEAHMLGAWHAFSILQMVDMASLPPTDHSGHGSASSHSSSL